PARRSALKPSTFASYEMYASTYVAGSALGSMLLSRVDGPALNIFYAELLVAGRRQRSGGLSAKTVRNIHGMLHKALSDAMKWGRVMRNAADAADQPRKASQ